MLGFLRKGISYKAACSMSGVSFPTFLAERERDPEFSQAITKAEDTARAKLEERFFAASKDDWKAAERFLSRKYYEEWAQRKPDAIEIRKLMRHFTALVSGILEFLKEGRHEEFKFWFQNWIDRVLSDDFDNGAATS